MGRSDCIVDWDSSEQWEW